MIRPWQLHKCEKRYCPSYTGEGAHTLQDMKNWWHRDTSHAENIFQQGFALPQGGRFVGNWAGVYPEPNEVIFHGSTVTQSRDLGAHRRSRSSGELTRFVKTKQHSQGHPTASGLGWIAASWFMVLFGDVDPNDPETFMEDDVEPSRKVTWGPSPRQVWRVGTTSKLLSTTIVLASWPTTVINEDIQ